MFQRSTLVPWELPPTSQLAYSRSSRNSPARRSSTRQLTAVTAVSMPPLLRFSRVYWDAAVGLAQLRCTPGLHGWQPQWHPCRLRGSCPPLPEYRSARIRPGFSRSPNWRWWLLRWLLLSSHWKWWLLLRTLALDPAWNGPLRDSWSQNLVHQLHHLQETCPHLVPQTLADPSLLRLAVRFRCLRQGKVHC
ncbi:hypothetical protein KR032_007144 [Drosophila birchii]|nr:hypothetical protein KR032_007144 [Drosophila birchii]